MLMYVPWIFYAYKFSKAYVKNSKGIYLGEEAIKVAKKTLAECNSFWEVIDCIAAKIDRYTSWILEKIDLVKDWIYLFLF